MSALNETERFRVVCLTGGPCGGKTSSLSILAEYFETLGWKVYRVPETSSLLKGGGVVFEELTPEMSYSFQKSLLKTMLTIEDTYRQLGKLSAQAGRPTMLICDRGAMDPSAYMDREGWLRMLRELGQDEAQLRDQRYDCVVHLVTAAKGAERFYGNANNMTRTEDVDTARNIDNATMKAWMGHAGLQVVDNEHVGSFAEKCDCVIRAVTTRLGLISDSAATDAATASRQATPPRTGISGAGVPMPVPTHRIAKPVKKRKFLVVGPTSVAAIASSDQVDGFPVPSRLFEVLHTYLNTPTANTVQARIRCRTEQGSMALHLSLTTRMRTAGTGDAAAPADGQLVETRRNLTETAYSILAQQADPSRVPVRKRRRCFLYRDRYFQLDTYLDPFPGLMLLEGYLDADLTDDVAGQHALSRALPDFLQLREVTDDPAWSMFTLAARAHPARGDVAALIASHPAATAS